MTEEEINKFILDNFWLKVDKIGNCWNWIGGRNWEGYGKFFANYKFISAHRFSYELHKGKIPEGMNIDHLCRNHACVNPEHLEAVTCRENIRRGLKGILKTHCKHGHPFSGDNLYLYPDGERGCRQCKSDFDKKKYQKQKMEKLSLSR